MVTRVACILALTTGHSGTAHEVSMHNIGRTWSHYKPRARVPVCIFNVALKTRDARCTLLEHVFPMTFKWSKYTSTTVMTKRLHVIILLL
jgi:hypothetical protein